MKEGSRGLREKQDTVYTQKEIGRPRDSHLNRKWSSAPPSQLH